MLTEQITLDLVQTAARLGTKGRPMRLDTLYRLVRGGAFEGAHKVDGQWRIPVTAIKARIARRSKKIRPDSPADVSA